MTLSGLVYCAYIGPRGLQKLLETNKSNSMCTFISVPVYLCISLFTNFLTASTYSLESALLHVYPSIYTGTHPSIHPSIHPSAIAASTYLSIYLCNGSTYQFIYPSICPPMHTMQYNTAQDGAMKCHTSIHICAVDSM